MVVRYAQRYSFCGAYFDFSTRWANSVPSGGVAQCRPKTRASHITRGGASFFPGYLANRADMVKSSCRRLPRDVFRDILSARKF
jgi:hypothetical protein